MTVLLDFIKNNPKLKLVADSRTVDSTSLFFAIKGVQHDGHEHLQAVIKAGVAAIVVNSSQREQWEHLNFSGPLFEVPDSKVAWVEAWRFQSDYPDEKLLVLGVTGTNGKTSTVHMLEHILNQAHIPCGVIGTIDSHLGKQQWPSPLTTPGPDILFPQLKNFLHAQAQACALEISSHGLHQKRMQGLQIDVGIFSNLTPDHLDYHKNMQEYFLAKQLLFTDLLEKSNKTQRVAVINLMDERGMDMQVSPMIKTYYFYEPQGLSTSYQRQVSDFLLKQRQLGIDIEEVRVEIIKSDQYSSDFKLHLDKDILTFKLPVVGKFQIFNWTQSVLAVWDRVNKDVALLEKSASTFRGIPGRMQKVLLPVTDKNIFVDYAHTPDALERALTSLRASTLGKVIVVFGCGGDRDQGKRPLMAEVAQRCADEVIVTNDNPRTESPQQIAEQILKGFKNIKPQVILDRSQAIQYGCSRLASVKDVLLIAGKGHEDYQIIGTEKKYFSDYEEVLKLFN